MKKFILFLSALFLFCLSSCAVKADVRPMARALDNEEEITSSQVIEEESASSYEEEISSSQIAEEEKVTIVSKAANWIEEKIVPLFGFVTVSNVLTIVGFIATLVMKFKGEKKYKTERKTDNDAYIAKINSLEEKIGVLENKVELLEIADNNHSAEWAKMSENVEKIIITAEDVFGVAKEQNDNLINVANMKTAIEVSCKLMAKSLALSDVAVKSGIAEDAQKLIKTIEGGDSDGGKEK